MKILKNIIVKGKHSKPIIIDTFYNNNQQAKPVVIFCHGYKGYKDWGAWNLVAQRFAQNDFFFIKMNFSHNGGTIEQPIDFPDLEAFGQNNFTKELDDIDSVINWVFNNKSVESEIDLTQISLIGHSRGGGIVLIKANEDNRITKVVTWAGVSDFGERFPSGETLQNWEKEGIAYILNGRTKQQMPHYYQFYKNFKENEKRLNVKNVVQNIQIPYLVVHGSKDETVPLKEAKALLNWNTNNQIFIVEGSNHNFGSSQPWESFKLPNDLKIVTNKTIRFIDK